MKINLDSYEQENKRILKEESQAINEFPQKIVIFQSNSQ